MRGLARLAAVSVLAVALAGASPARASVEAGAKAYDRHDYATSLKLLRPEAERGSANLVTNIFCENALETALQFRDAHGGKITAVSCGPDGAEELIQYPIPFETNELVSRKLDNLTGGKYLTERGLLDETLVVFMSEFGRTPGPLNHILGRDHHKHVFPAMFAGAGVKGGQAVGRTDKEGGTVEEGRVTAVDFMATVCTALGVDYKKNFYSRDGRPMRIVDKNEKVVKELFS